MYAIMGFVLGAAVSGGSAAVAAGIMAQPRTAEIVIDGRPADLRGYLIEGSHYFQLRDLSEKLAPGGKDFSIVWDGANNRVLIDTSKGYTPEVQSPQAKPASDYSIQANPAIFDSYYTREKYNEDRQRVLDTGTYVFWGTRRTPQSMDAVNAANTFFASLLQMTDLEKVRSINSYLCEHITYKAESVFVGDDFWTGGMAYGVCEDYARTFQYMCYRAGLPCDFIVGDRLPAKSTGRHGWNEVYFDGRWHFYDGTLSDSRNRLILADTAESATTGYTYTDDTPRSTMYRKEVYAPGSTM